MARPPAALAAAGGPAGIAVRLLGAGVVLGVAAGAAWAAAQRGGRALAERVTRDGADNPTLINWHWAQTIATRLARGAEAGTGASTAERDDAGREYTSLVERAAGLVAAYTGITLPAPLTQVHVFDRAEWVAANITQFQIMFGALDEAYGATLARTRGAAPVGAAGQVMLSGQMGLLLGYLARRVLGQYDLSLLGREPVTGGRLYFVQPNIAAVENRYRLPPDEFRAWIALHEVTHAFEFEAHPWVREHMNGLLSDYLRLLSDDLFGNRPGGMVNTLVSRLRENSSQSNHMLELMMSREQRAVFRQLQALMALMEGYSNHVMDEIGAERLPGHARLKQTFESRARSRGPAEQLFIKLTGLDIKLEQYALGEQFCRHVVDRRGVSTLNRVWESADHLPTLDEIYDPDRWLTRHEVRAA